MWTHTVSCAHERRAVATAQAHVMEVSQGSGVCAALCIRRTLCRHVTIGTPMVIFLLFDCRLTVFWRMVHCTNRQKHSKPLVYQSLQVYQDCTNSVPTVYKSSQTVKRQSKQQKWPLVYQSSHVYQDCTNSVQTVYQSSKTVKTAQKWPLGLPVVTCLPRRTNRVPTVYQKAVKTAKMTIGVPIVTGLPRLYQQCNNSLPIVNKNLVIANTCAHNTSRAFIDLNITPWPWNLDYGSLKVTGNWTTGQIIHDLLLVELFDVKYYRNLEMWFSGHSRSLKVVPLESFGTVSYRLP